MSQVAQHSIDTMPSRITLDKFYLFNESESHRTTDWATPLWQYLKINVPFACDISVLRNQELSKVLHERFINYVISLLITGACHALETHPGGNPDDDQRTELLAESIDSILEVETETRDTIAWYLERICDRILSKKAEPSSGQRSAILRKATEHGHRCYLCGRTLHYRHRPFGSDETENIDKIREMRSFEIEHIWSQARGGSRHRENLAASCKQCNKIKRHLLSFADISIEQIMTTASKPKSIRASMSGDFRLALLWHQKGCCAMCRKKLHNIDSEHLFLAKKETSQPYHFFNMMAVCNQCNSDYNFNGVDLRA
ncbi:HNH endonuclease [Pseudomonas aeruginosa]|uniref:HNH endonuclease n=1 Tax=Pseudomonas aeruginosa TaxID=287 RepID=UPI00234261DD|nr:HNH endonuclease [Pseudomonas aeruginosa]MDC3993170.1 HNH endonuclease [Pseudomonas aeruginosa]